MVDGYEPHGMIPPAGMTRAPVPMTHRAVRGCTRGGDRWEGWEGYTGYYPGTLPDPYSSIFKVKGPTHGQMKLFLEVSMRFLR